MAYNQNNPNGSATSANSAPVVIASDQGAIPVATHTVNIGTPGTLATAAKQPALGTAGTPSADVITVQGVASGTPQPVSSASIEQPALSAGALNADLVAATDVSAYRALSIHVLGTYVGTLTFQGSNDNTNWVSVELTNQTTGGLTSTTTSTGVLYIAAVAYRYFRCRMTAWTSGSATGVAEFYTLPVTTIGTAAVQSGSWTVQPGNNANTTPWSVAAAAGSAIIGKVGIDQTTPGTTNGVSVQGVNGSNGVGGFNPILAYGAGDADGNDNGLIVNAHGQVWNGTTWTRTKSVAAGIQGVGINDGTNTANILKGDGTAAGQNSQLVAGAYKEMTGSVAAVGTIIASTDVSNYKFASLQLSGFGTATVQLMWSNDNVTFFQGSAYSATATNSSSTNITSNGIYTFATLGRYLKVTTSAWTSGTIVGTLELYTIAPQPFVIGVNSSQSGTWTVQPGNTANSTPWLTQTVAATTGGYTPGKLISAATTNATSIKASAGTVGFLVVGSINAAARYIKLYDKASAPTVGTDVPVATFIIPGNTAGAGTNIPLPPQGLNFAAGIAFALTTGITDADTTAVAASEITVSYGYK